MAIKGSRSQDPGRRRGVHPRRRAGPAPRRARYLSADAGGEGTATGAGNAGPQDAEGAQTNMVCAATPEGGNTGSELDTHRRRHQEGALERCRRRHGCGATAAAAAATPESTAAVLSSARALRASSSRQCESRNIQRIGTPRITSHIADRDENHHTSWNTMTLQQRAMRDEDLVWKEMRNIGGHRIYVNDPNCAHTAIAISNAISARLLGHRRGHHGQPENLHREIVRADSLVARSGLQRLHHGHETEHG